MDLALDPSHVPLTATEFRHSPARRGRAPFNRHGGGFGFLGWFGLGCNKSGYDYLCDLAAVFVEIYPVGLPAGGLIFAYAAAA